jgi:plastocyanin
MKTAFLLAFMMITAIMVSGCVSTDVNNTIIKTKEPPPRPGNVIIQNFAFSPAELIVKKGVEVVWTNAEEAPHTITSDWGTELNSGTLSTGQTYTHAFEQAGAYSYHCSLHPTMKGKIIVTDE